jgi:hypothetical protein
MIKNNNVSSLYTLRTEPSNASVCTTRKKIGQKAQKRNIDVCDTKEVKGKILNKRLI